MVRRRRAANQQQKAKRRDGGGAAAHAQPQALAASAWQRVSIARACGKRLADGRRAVLRMQASYYERRRRPGSAIALGGGDGPAKATHAEIRDETGGAAQTASVACA
jgi:hypothetical protein